MRELWISEKDSASNARDSGLIPGLGRSPGKGNGYPLQYTCLENSMDRGSWRATVFGDAKRLILFTFSTISSHRCLGFFLDSQFCFIVFCSLHCFDYYSFVLSSEIGKCGSINFFFLRLLWLAETSYNSIGI